MSESYYKVIDGTKYDKKMLDLADEAVAGKGDGRISIGDAVKIMPAITDGNTFSDVEKVTVRYIKANYKFTPEGLTHFDTELAKLEPPAKPGYYRTIDGVRYDRGMLDSADEAVKGQGDGRISLDDAKKLILAVTDGGAYTDTEKVTMKYIRDNYKFTDEADGWIRTEIRKWAATK